MTAAELIEELRKLPAEQPVLIEWPGEFDYETGAEGLNLGSVDDLRVAQAFLHKQPVIIITAAAWVR